MIIALTGHRPQRLGNEYYGVGPYTEYIVGELEKLCERYRPKKGISGLALGSDMIWAVYCLSRNIPLIAAVPFEGQHVRWTDQNKDIYWRILNHPLTETVYVCEPGYAAWKMQKRNEWMVDHADRLIAVWDESEGGTANCVKYAKSKLIPIDYIDPKKALE